MVSLSMIGERNNDSNWLMRFQLNFVVLLTIRNTRFNLLCYPFAHESLSIHAGKAQCMDDSDKSFILTGKIFGRTVIWIDVRM